MVPLLPQPQSSTVEHGVSSLEQSPGNAGASVGPKALSLTVGGGEGDDVGSDVGSGVGLGVAGASHVRVPSIHSNGLQHLPSLPPHAVPAAELHDGGS